MMLFIVPFWFIIIRSASCSNFEFDRNMLIIITQRCLSVYLHDSDSIDSNLTITVSSLVLKELLLYEHVVVRIKRMQNEQYLIINKC